MPLKIFTHGHRRSSSPPHPSPTLNTIITSCSSSFAIASPILSTTLSATSGSGSTLTPSTTSASTSTSRSDPHSTLALVTTTVSPTRVVSSTPVLSFTPEQEYAHTFSLYFTRLHQLRGNINAYLWRIDDLLEENMYLRNVQKELFENVDPQLELLEDRLERLKEVVVKESWMCSDLSKELARGEKRVGVAVDVKMVEVGEKMLNIKKSFLGISLGKKTENKIAEAEEIEEGIVGVRVEEDGESAAAKEQKLEETVKSLEKKLQAWIELVKAYGTQLERICDEVGYNSEYVYIKK